MNDQITKLYEIIEELEYRIVKLENEIRKLKQNKI